MNKILIGALSLFIMSTYSFASAPCGLEGSLKERVEECQKVEPEQSSNFRLVSRNGKGQFILLDVKTNLLWSQHLWVGDQYKYYNKVTIRTIHSVCQRFQPFNLKTKDKTLTWRLPTPRELKSSFKRGNTSVGSWGVLSSRIKRKSFPVLKYGQENSIVTYEFPKAFSEASGRIYLMDESIGQATFRCVIDKDLIEQSWNLEL